MTISDPGDAPARAAQALGRTLASGGARVRLEVNQHFPKLPSRRRSGGLLEPLVRLGAKAGKRALAPLLDKKGHEY